MVVEGWAPPTSLPRSKRTNPSPSFPGARTAHNERRAVNTASCGMGRPITGAATMTYKLWVVHFSLGIWSTTLTKKRGGVPHGEVPVYELSVRFRSFSHLKKKIGFLVAIEHLLEVVTLAIHLVHTCLTDGTLKPLTKKRGRVLLTLPLKIFQVVTCLTQLGPVFLRMASYSAPRVVTFRDTLSLLPPQLKSSGFCLFWGDVRVVDCLLDDSVSSVHDPNSS